MLAGLNDRLPSGWMKIRSNISKHIPVCGTLIPGLHYKHSFSFRVSSFELGIIGKKEEQDSRLRGNDGGGLDYGYQKRPMNRATTITSKAKALPYVLEG